MPLTAQQYERFKPMVSTGKRPDGMSDEYFTALQKAVDEYDQQMLGKWGSTQPMPNKASTGELGVTSVLGAPRGHGVERLAAPAQALEEQINPDLPVPAQVLAMSPATTHPEGDEAARDEWYRTPGGDNPNGSVVVYDMPVDVARKKLLEHPELFPALGFKSTIPTGEEILAMRPGGSLHQAVNDLEWREAANAAASAGKTAYRYSKAPFLQGEGITGPMQTLGLKLSTGIAPTVEGLRAFVLGVDHIATLGAGKALSEADDRMWNRIDPREKKEGPQTDVFGNEVVGGIGAAGDDLRAQNDSLIEDNPLKYQLGQGVAALAPWAPANRAWNFVTSGGEALAARALPKFFTQNPFGRVATGMGLSGAAGGLMHLGQEGVEALNNLDESGSTGTTASDVIGRTGEAARGAAAVGGGLQLLGQIGKAEADWTRDVRSGGDVRQIERSGGRVALGRGPVAPDEYVAAQKAAREAGIPNHPEQIIAEELTPKMTEGARAVHGDAKKAVAQEKAAHYPTAEGQEELPVTNLVTKAADLLRGHFSRGGRKALETVGTRGAGANVKEVFNVNIERVSREPVAGAIELTPREADAFLDAARKRELLRGPKAGQRQNSSGARELDLEAGETGGADLGEKAIEESGLKKVYVVPRKYDAKHTDQAITNVANKGKGFGVKDKAPDRDMDALRDALYADRTMRKADGVQGGWSAKRAEQEQRLSKARDTRDRVLPRSAETGPRQTAHNVLADFANSTDLPTIRAVREVAERQGIGPRVEQLRLGRAFHNQTQRASLGRAPNGTAPNVGEMGSVWGRGFDPANLRLIYPLASAAERHLNPLGAGAQLGLVAADMLSDTDPGDIRRRAREESLKQSYSEKRQAELKRRADAEKPKKKAKKR